MSPSRWTSARDQGCDCTVHSRGPPSDGEAGLLASHQANLILTNEDTNSHPPGSLPTTWEQVRTCCRPPGKARTRC